MENGSQSKQYAKGLKRAISDGDGNGNNLADDDNQVVVSTVTRIKKEFSLSETLTDLENFDCSICMKLLTPPVFQCQNGHIACSGCCTAVKNKCPSCRMHVGSIRCLIVEKIIESMKIACKYKEYGCAHTLSCAEKLKHEETCVCVPFTCPVAGCNLSLPLTQLLLHVSTNHRSSVRRFRYNIVFAVGLSKLDKYVVLQRAGENGRIFILCNQVSPQHSVISLACLGSKTDHHGRLKYELVSTKEERSYSLKGVVECVQKPSDASLVVDALRIPNDFYSSEEFELQIQICDIT